MKKGGKLKKWEMKKRGKQKTGQIEKKALFGLFKKIASKRAVHFDPNTQEQCSYDTLMERCKQNESGFFLFVVDGKTVNRKNTLKRDRGVSRTRIDSARKNFLKDKFSKVVNKQVDKVQEDRRKSVTEIKTVSELFNGLSQRKESVGSDGVKKPEPKIHLSTREFIEKGEKKEIAVNFLVNSQSDDLIIQ